MVACNNNNKNL